MKDILHRIDTGTDGGDRDARRIRAVQVGHLALFVLVLALTAVTLGRARADDPATVVLRLPWVADPQP
jgi:hypothetical protein